jgi:non-lysosomal glucosylceramidase
MNRALPEDRLFPDGLPARQCSEFRADGYERPVCGAPFRGSDPPVCGMPLGGLDTGCLDLEANGLWGYSSIFNSLTPRRGPMRLPFLGLVVEKQTWVLTTLPMRWREDVTHNDNYGKGEYPPVKTASEIDYFGHYPVADLEYRTDAPVSVGLRAWSPFVPGDVGTSLLPGAVFEVRLRNRDAAAHAVSVVFSFPGPNEAEAGTTRFERKELRETLGGVEVGSARASYVLAAIGEEKARVGGDLATDGEAWAMVVHRLPYAREQAGSSVAIDLRLEPGARRAVRFVLAWHAPVWNGGGTPVAQGNEYTHFSARHHPSAQAAAEVLARDHAALLRRVLAWQEVVYAEESLPPWLRDSLVNVLHLVTETSVWAQARPPVGSWCRPEDGVFGMNESPRWCPQIECIPCSFYGSLPLVYFFPEAALSTLRATRAYQAPSGQLPWVYGGCTTGTGPYEMALPALGYATMPQTTLDGPSWADMVDKMWLRTGDEAVLREFYDSVKRNAIFTMNLRPGSGPAGVVSMPAGNQGQDWFESVSLYGIVPHIGGAHLAQLAIARRMARAMGDHAFAAQCEEWLQGGSRVLEEHGWAGTHYLLFNEPETGKRSDVVLGYQLDGEWMARFHGLEGVFRKDRVAATLDTIERTNVALTRFGALVFCTADGKTLAKGDLNPGYWGANGVHPPGTFMLGMTFAYAGRAGSGLELVRRCLAEVVKRGWVWDFPVAIDPADHTRVGTDYYQNLMMWSLPAVLAGGDLAGPCRPGGLVDRILKAGTLRQTP